MRQPLGNIHRIGAFVYLAGVVTQFFLAGLGIFGAASLDPHRMLGMLVILLSLILLVLALISRRSPRRDRPAVRVQRHPDVAGVVSGGRARGVGASPRQRALAALPGSGRGPRAYACHPPPWAGWSILVRLARRRAVGAATGRRLPLWP